MPKVVAYYRVSTARQGRSGLGLDAQRATVRGLPGIEVSDLVEFVEVESGRKAARPQLQAALDAARVHGARLVVAKVDRLTRDVGFLQTLLDAGVEIVFADLPSIQGAVGRFLLLQMVAVAQLEAGLISERTKAALAAAKARGTVLGGWRGGPVVDQAHGLAAAKAKATTAAKRYSSTIAALRAQGIESATGMARELNARGIRTPRGSAWQTTTVQRLLARLAA
ncbi:MAG: recombinase family protein [bacterium]|jgi:DNA invertase Pin-like site-specific DNA recombinase